MDDGEAIQGSYKKICLNIAHHDDKWKLVAFKTPSDGNCLFHAIANSFSICYYEEKIGTKKVSKKRIIKLLREKLADRLDEKTYNELSGGNIGIFSTSVTEFSLPMMKKNLRRMGVFIGYGYIEHISNILNKDIYIIEDKRLDIYRSDDLIYTIKGNRSSIVLYYYDYGHYELVGVQKDGQFYTHFSPEHSFIRFLYHRVQSLIALNPDIPQLH